MGGGGAESLAIVERGLRGDLIFERKKCKKIFEKNIEFKNKNIKNISNFFSKIFMVNISMLTNP